MGFPAQIKRTDLHYPDDDRITHFAAREFQIAMRIIIVLSIIAIAVLMVLFPPWGWVPAPVLCLAYIGLIISSSAERRTRRERYERQMHAHREQLAHEIDPEEDTPALAAFLAKDDEHFIPPRLLWRDSVIGIEILVGLGLAAVALVVVGVATGALPWELVAIAGGLIVAYGLFIMAPVWLGWLTDEEEMARGTISNERVRPQLHK